MLVNNAVYKYETPYNGPFMITKCWTNRTVKLQCGETTSRHNIRCINPYTSDKNVEDINIEKYV